MKNKILSLVLVLSMLVGMLAVIPMTVSAEATNVWDGSVAASFAGGDGTENDPYQISNGAELALMSQKITVDKDGNYNRAHYVLTADIVLNDMPHVSTWYDGWYNGAADAYEPENMFTPIGTWSNDTSSFGGTFDGAGHTVSGAYFYTESGDNHGFFGAIQGGAVIKNFALVNSLFGNEGGNIAAIAGTTDRCNEGDILIENIYVDAYVYSGSANAGGILGTLSNSQTGYSAGIVTVSRVTFVGSVEGTNFVAGLIADARNVVFDVDDCLVSADIRATAKPTSKDNVHSAGFVTRSNNNLSLISQYDQVITNCILAGGSVTSKTDNSYDYPRAYVSSRSSTSKILAEYCYNAISGLSTMRYADTADDAAPSADIIKSELYGSFEGDTDVDWSVLTNWARPDYDIARPKGIAENFEIDPIEPPKAFENGSGTEDDPYQIANADDLANLANISQTDSFEGVYFELTADIILTGENNHAPIGNWTYAFGGVFDGGNHTISGLHMSANGDGYGFFAAIQGGAVIKNLAFVDATVIATGAGATGILVGQTNRGSGDDIYIENVYVEGSVTANGTEVAGIIGNLSDSNSSYTAGTVYVNKTTFVGSVSGTDVVAGIIGNIRNVMVEVTNCLVNADIEATNGGTAAGIMSRSGNATMMGYLDEAYLQVARYCLVAGGSISGTGSNHRAYISSTNGTNKPLSEYNYDAVGVTDVRNADDETSADITKYALYGMDDSNIDWTTWAEGNWTTKTDDVPRPDGIAENFTILPPQFFEGEGTQANPYKINNADDLKTLSNLSQSDSFEGVYFVLTADITLTGTNNHKAIGSWAYGFGGNFNGQGHTISGLHISTSADGQGLFGVIQGGAVITNFALVDAYVRCSSTGNMPVGAIVGQTNRANGGDIVISNIYTDAVVDCAGKEIGGIIGNLSNAQNDYVPGTVSVSNVVFNGTVKAAGYAAGIVGDARDVKVVMENCANYGTISASGDYVAGLLVGQTGSYTITNCISAGNVTGNNSVLAIACCNAENADAEGVRTITNCYVLAGIAANGSTMNADGGATITVVKNMSSFMGNGAVTINGWVKNAGDVTVPANCNAPEIVFTQKMLNGASVRFDTPTGLRFTAILSGAYLNYLKGDGEATYGIIIAPTDYVEAAGGFTIEKLDALGLDSVAYVIVPAEILYSGGDEYGYYEFRGVLGGINDYNYDRNFSAIAYVCVDGVYYYSAYDEDFNSRSIAYVAQAAYEDTNYEETSEYKYEVVEGQGDAGVWSPYTTEQREILLGFFGKSDAVNLSFLSYNVRNAEMDETDLGFIQIEKPTYEYDNRETYVLEYLLGYGADIIGLQEVAYVDGTYSDLNMLDVLGTEINKTGLTAAGYTCVTGEEIYGGHHAYKQMWNPIYFKTDMFDLIAQDTIWFTDADSRDTASKIQDDDTPYKSLTYVVLEHKESGERFVYVNLHLIVREKNKARYYLEDNNGNVLYDAEGTPRQIQEKQVIYLREILQSIQDEYDLPMFIGGDFNNSYNGINTWFKKSVYDEDGVISNGTPEETVKLSIARDTASSKQVANSCASGGNFTTRITIGGSPIDLWFTSNFNNGFVQCYQIIDNWNESIQKYPSDHCPAKLYATLYID